MNYDTQKRYGPVLVKQLKKAKYAYACNILRSVHYSNLNWYHRLFDSDYKQSLVIPKRRWYYDQLRKCWRYKPIW